MREIIDIRVDEEWAQKEFGSSLGETLRSAPYTGNKAIDDETDRLFPPMTRKIVLDTRDPRLDDFRNRLLRDEATVLGIRGAILIDREYSEKELNAAQFLTLIIDSVFEPAGEDMGTEYDDSKACPKCGAGRVQRSPLRLNLHSIPKNVEIARTISFDEWIVSESLADLLRKEKVTGFQLQEVEHRGKRRPEKKWYQILVTGKAGNTVDPTRFGIDYLHPDPEGRFVCTQHFLSGLNILSEVFLRRDSVETVDVAATTNRFGLRGGVLVPIPILVISQRLLQILSQHGIRGYKVEVAHLV